MTDKPSTQTNESSKNPNGQRHTMANAPVRSWMPEAADLSATVNKAVDPMSNTGHARLDKD